jgi:hypothetical protein
MMENFYLRNVIIELAVNIRTQLYAHQKLSAIIKINKRRRSRKRKEPESGQE